PDLAVVVAQREGAPGQRPAAGALGQLGDRDREVDRQPVPEARRRGRVCVEAAHREATGLRGEPGPGQLRRDVLSAYPGVDEHLVDLLAVGHVLAGHREGADRGRSWYGSGATGRSRLIVVLQANPSV